jgi:hypothetical protein
MKKILSIGLVIPFLFFAELALADSEYSEATTGQLIGLLGEMDSTRNIAHMYQLDSVSSTLGSIEKDIANEIVRRTRKDVEGQVKARKEKRKQIKQLQKNQD